MLRQKLTKPQLDNKAIENCNENCQPKREREREREREVAWLSKMFVNAKQWKGWRFNIKPILLMID